MNIAKSNLLTLISVSSSDRWLRSFISIGLLFAISSCSDDWGSTYIEGAVVRADTQRPVSSQTITVYGIKKTKFSILGNWGQGDESIIATHETTTDSLGWFALAIERNKEVDYYSIRVDNVINTAESSNFWCESLEVLPSNSLEPEEAHRVGIFITCPTYVSGVIGNEQGDVQSGVEVVLIGFAENAEILRLLETTDNDGRFYFPVDYDENLTNLRLTLVGREFSCEPARCDALMIGEQNNLEIVISDE